MGMLLLLALLSLGFIVVRIVDPDSAGGDHIGTYFPIGVGVASYSMFLVSWAGLPLDLPVLLGLILLLLVLGVAAVGWRRSRESRKPKALEFRVDHQQTPQWAAILFGLIVIIAGLVSVGRSYSTWDAMAAYSIKGYAIARYGSIDVADQWGSGSGYPLSIPLVISLFDSLQGDAEPLSKLVFPLFYSSAIIGMFQFWTRNRVRSTYAAIGGLLFATIPVVFEHGTSGYVNLPFACSLTLGVLQVVDGLIRHSLRQQALGGILLGISTWIRPDGLPIAMSAILGLVAASRIARLAYPALRVVLGPVVLVSGAWQLYSWLVSPGGAQGAMLQLSGAFLSGVGQGQLNLDAFYWIGRFTAGQLTDPASWGLLVPVALLTIVVNRRALAKRGLPTSFVLLVVTLIVGATLVVFYYLISFNGDLLYWLGTDVNRMLLPVALLGWTWLFSLWADGTHSDPGDQTSAGQTLPEGGKL